MHILLDMPTFWSNANPLGSLWYGIFLLEMHTFRCNASSDNVYTLLEMEFVYGILTSCAKTISNLLS